MKVHNILFYLNPALIDVNTPAALEKYVADLNAILFKNTDRLLVFEPQMGVIPASAAPHDNSHNGPLPSEDFDVWVYVTLGPWQSGYAGIDSSGAGVISTEWQAVYSEYGQDYQRQVYVLAHELGHVFGAGMSEYYTLQSVADLSGRAPSLPINLLDPTNAFTASHLDWLTSPMLWNVGGPTREAFLSTCKYDTAAALTINSAWRSGIPPLASMTVRVLSQRSRVLDIPYTVYVYNRDGALLASGEADENGNFTAPAPQHNGYRNAVLIKVYQGARFTGAKWISVYDLDKMRLSSGQSECIISIP